ncbi:PREDICTED: ribosomal biogenesis protein LAS1L [Cyprinodon variegatus]|uniref:ribosomal biogenesis protein LAS1L n=1 Tax=Cyprinodon variegatus TaxID=28743 RepID=UPI000742A69F|nr:PREDICTED: ribosomal biogenesis protein LAS1L [Cyprinodon variegatus]
MKKSSSEKRRHVVAWITKAEWDQVLDYLYSKDPALQRFALHRVSAWKARYAHSTPVAVDCTAELVRCQVLERSGQLGGDELVLLYGTALVRFVNLITERKQGMKAQPLRRLAGRLNIPEWVVDLRHAFTHRKLPTLRWCRKGCRVALDWLQQEYWSRQLGGGAEEDWEAQSDGEEEEDAERRRQEELMSRQKEMEVYKAARDLLVSYEEERFKTLDGAQEEPPPFADLSWLLEEIKQASLESSQLLVEVLLEDGFLVPTAQQLETLGCEPPESSGSSEPRIPPVFLRFWLPLLRMLHSPSFIHLLLEKLLLELKLLSGGQNERRLFFVCAWTSEVILCNSNKFQFRFEKKTQKKARMKERIYVNRIQLRWQQLLSACLEAPCVYTPHLLQVILDDMEHPLPQETQQKLLQLCSIYTQTSSTELRPPKEQQQQPVYTLESLQQRGPLRSSSERSEAPGDPRGAEALAEKAKLLRGSPWQVCFDKVQWKNFPLGKVPGQQEDPSCLMAETYSAMAVSEQPMELEGGRKQAAPGASGLTRTAEGLLWTQSDVSRLKSGLKLF